MIDTSDEKFQNSIGLQRWANLENLKIAAQTYHEVESITELQQKIATLNETGKSAKQTIVVMEKQMKSLAEVLKYANQYQENRSFQIRYKKAKNPDTFLRKYESQLILYDGATRMLEQFGISPTSCNVEKLKQYLGQDSVTVAKPETSLTRKTLLLYNDQKIRGAKAPPTL